MLSSYGLRWYIFQDCPVCATRPVSPCVHPYPPTHGEIWGRNAPGRQFREVTQIRVSRHTSAYYIGLWPTLTAYSLHSVLHKRDTHVRCCWQHTWYFNNNPGGIVRVNRVIHIRGKARGGVYPPYIYLCCEDVCIILMQQ